MEGFLEANRVLELSLSKLAIGSGNLPLRKTLFVTRVLNKAQDMATSAQDRLFSSPHKNSSKLLASFGHNIDGVPESHLRIPKPQRQQSPIATDCHEIHMTPLVQPDEESMDFENVSSYLGNILNDYEPHDLTPTPQLMEDSSTFRPVSPGKRNYQQAFPFVTDCPQSAYQESCEDLKRFKASPLDSLPGFCGHLSSKNLQTAPFITYMFGRGFTHPSNTDSAGDWPSTNTRTDHIDPELITPLNNSSSPILAF